jgi:putative lysine transport system substrate-binding protein
MKKNMKKKLVGIFMAVVTAVTVLTGCGSEDSSTTSSSDKKVLKVGMECAYAPFNWTQLTEDLSDGSKAVKIYGTDYYAYGYDVAVAQKLADELGMELEVHKVEWTSIGTALDAGEYDCIIAGMGKTAEREESYSFTDVYYYRSNCLVVKKDSGLEDITGLSDLAGKGVKVTTQLGTGWINLLDQIPDGVTGTNYETTSECFMAIQNGVADVCVIDLPTALAAQSTNDDLVIIELDENDAFENDAEMTNVCIATRKSDTELRDKLQDAMDAIGWNDKDTMDELMETMITLMPSAE